MKKNVECGLKFQVDTVFLSFFSWFWAGVSPELPGKQNIYRRLGGGSLRGSFHHISQCLVCSARGLYNFFAVLNKILQSIPYGSWLFYYLKIFVKKVWFLFLSMTAYYFLVMDDS